MPESLDNSLVEQLDSADWTAVLDAVEAVGDCLRARRIDQRLKSDMADRLLRLSSHPKWEVRKAVAHALLYVRHDVFHLAISRIVQDENAWVREAARKTLQRRTEMTRTDIHGDNHGDAVLSMLSDLEVRYGLRARRNALKVADHLSFRFVREAYHEIVRVISPLDLSLTNLEKELSGIPAVPPHSHARLRRAREQVKLLTDILDSLREFTTDVQRDFTVEDVLSILREAEELAVGNADQPEFGLAVRYESEPSLRIESQRSRLLQALINIIVNAIEACHGIARKAEILIIARCESATHIAVSVVDNGRGMNDDAVKECVRLYSTGKPGGLGFGLPLAKRIVEKDHQGTLSIESRLGEGTKVSILLPIEQFGGED